MLKLKNEQASQDIKENLERITNFIEDKVISENPLREQCEQLKKDNGGQAPEKGTDDRYLWDECDCDSYFRK